MQRKSLFENSLRRHIKHDLKKVKLNEADALLDAMEEGNDEMGKDDLDVGERSLEDAMGFDAEYEQQRSQIQNQKIQKAIEKQQSDADAVLMQWIEKIDDFVSFINDPEEPNSIRSILNNAIPGTVMDKITGPDLRRINKVATEASSLSQSLRSYIGGVKDTKPFN